MSHSPPDSSNPYQTPDSEQKPDETDANSTLASPAEPSKGPLIIAGLVVLLLVLHQDNWFWTSKTLVFGFLPISLFWHACISIAASVTWCLATVVAWPTEANLTESADTPNPGDQ